MHRRAALIAVGTELLTGLRNDTNGVWLARALRRLGYTVVGRWIVPDADTAVQEALHAATRVAGVIVLTGGLGPTDDDRTREAVAAFLGRALEEAPTVRTRILAYYSERSATPPPIVLRMARVIAGAEVLPNPVGAAPGMWIDARDRVYILLPGPPAELQAVFEPAVRERLQQRATWPLPRWALFRTVGCPEVDIAERVKRIVDAYPGVEWSILPAPAQVDVELRMDAPDDSTWSRLLADVRIALGDDCYAEEDIPIEAVIGRLLRQRGHTLAVAESCTGGLIGHRITNVPGSSEYFMQGYVVYSNAAKVALLGVDPDTLQRFGAVSEPVAVQMAKGARTRAQVTWAVAVTGIAGPTGGTPQKPVGTVHIAVAGPSGTVHQKFRFNGTREQIKWQSAQMALDMLRRRLLHRED